MKYITNTRTPLGWIDISYDNINLTKEIRADGRVVEKISMTKEEMLDFINFRKAEELKNLEYEIVQIRKRYDERLSKIETFKLGLEKGC